MAELWLPALAWNGLFGAVAALALQDRLNTPSPAVDVLLLGLAALGPVLLVRAVVETLRARRFRGIRLEPDPPVASPGGELGGTVVVPGRTRRDDADFRIQLMCLRRQRRDDGVREQVVWTREVIPRVAPGSRATRLTFAVALDAGLPAVDGDSGDIRWIVRATGELPGLDLDAAFAVPVRHLDSPPASSIPLTPDEPAPLRDFRTRGVSVTRDAGALLVHYGARRSLGMGVAFGAFGSVSLASAGFMAVASGMTSLPWSGAFEVVMGLVAAFIVAAFGLVGLSLLILGVWLATNRLRAEVRPDRIRTRRWILWVIPAGGTDLAVDDVERVEARITSQAGQGTRASVGYRLVAHTAQGRVTLGDGIPGSGLLHHLTALVERETGLKVEIPARSMRPLRSPAGPGSG